MKKLLVVLAAVVLLASIVGWVVLTFRADDAVAASAARTWPGGLGTLDSVARRYPPQKANAASVQLAALTNAVPRSDAADAFVWREMTSGELAIGAPPPLPDVTKVRELLLREDVVRGRQGGIGDVGSEETTKMRATQMNAARALAASALAKARAKDPAAWDDLHALWKLARALESQPEMMMQTAVFAMDRTINALAWKMPLPAPAWFAEVQRRDYVLPLIRAFQYQAASYWQDGARMFPTKWLADSVERDRRIAESLFNLTTCDVNAPMNDLGVDLAAVWRRALRYRAEREATSNAIRIREGKPVESTSMCSDGQWSYDGTTLRFSRAIPTAAPDKPMPLVLRVSSDREKSR